MKLKVTAAVLLTAALFQRATAPVSAGPLNVIPCSIYGTDDRVDYYQADKVMKKLAESTAALFKDSDIPLDEASGQYKLKLLSLKDKYNLKPGQNFGAQPVGAFCSAALIGDDTVLTSGHCFKPDQRGGPCERVKFVFGYAVTKEGETPSSFAAADVYSCKAIKYQRVQDETANFACMSGNCREKALAGLGPDFAIVQLDRKVKGRYPLAVSRKAIAAGAKVAAVGYPSGLPVKVAGNGKVRSVSNKGYFVTDLDTFGGNSGGPVFNTATFKIEGVLSRGGVDYVYGAGTPVEDPKNPYLQVPGEANVYPQEGGRGEDVTLATEFESLIPVTEMEKALDNMQPASKKPQVTPAIYYPDGGGKVQPAIYNPPPASGPRVISI
ncbi:MAG TPA: trypsin-like peptidase domain-containing protein [Elusimicrobiales bacterium]|nr:trypsin-like peptidase domain-containing protein [Elusimicrobiales bacterium]